MAGTTVIISVREKPFLCAGNPLAAGVNFGATDQYEDPAALMQWRH